MANRSFSPWIVVATICLLQPYPLHAQTGIPGSGQRSPQGVVGTLPDDWHPGKFDRRTHKWLSETARNIKWVAALGSQTFGAPVVSGGRVFVGTNNSNGYLSRYPGVTDAGCLLCFSEADGKFLWQHSSEKLPSGRVNDLSMQGIQCSPWIEGERAWFVSNRGEVICLDTQGYADREDDGEPFTESSVLWPGFEKGNKAAFIADLDHQKIDQRLTDFLADHLKAKTTGYRLEVVNPGSAWRLVHGRDADLPSFILTPDFWGVRVARERAKPEPHDADVVWSLNMMEKFGSRQHTGSTCCVTVWKETLFVCTGNGVDESHISIPAPDAPSFVALDKSTGKVLWTSNLPGNNIHHGNWSSPVVGVLSGVPQVIFNGGDGWTYSFHAEEWQDSKPKLLWKFDTNTKGAVLELGGRGTRNEPIGAPVLHGDRVYITTGQDAEHGEGPGCIWCIDPTKRGDISAELVVLKTDPKTIISYHHRLPVQPKEGQVAIPNPNSAVIWKYVGQDQNADGMVDLNEQMHRTLSPVVITDDLLFANDFSGFLHCLDRKTGQLHWMYDALAATWCSPFVADGKVYVADEDGDIAIFQASANPTIAGKPQEHAGPILPLQIDAKHEINMLNSCYTSPTASKGVLFIANKDQLFAIDTSEHKSPRPQK